MEQALTEHELDDSKQYADVSNELEEVKTRLNEVLDDFDAEDFDSAFRRIDS